MSGSRDAYGHLVRDYHNGHPAREVIERSDGLIDPSSVAPGLYFAEFKDWPSVERRAMAYAKGRVIDVGCGAGRVALYLQNSKGLDVLGIDSSPLAVKVCRLRGLKKAKVIAFQDIKFPAGSFDSVIMLGNNFGLFGNRAGARRLLKKLWSMTAPGALIIGESVDPYQTDDPDHLAYHESNKAKGRMAGQVRIRVRYRTFVGRWFDYLLVSQSEMRELARGTGWRVRRFVTSAGSPLYVGVLERMDPPRLNEPDGLVDCV